MERREFLKKSSIAATAMMFPVVARGETAQSWSPYNAAMVIDALGAPGSTAFGSRVPLTASDLADVKSSGLTALNVTVSGVGSYAKDFEETLRNIAFWEEQIAAHPDALMKVVRGSDLDAAKKSGRLGLDLRISGWNSVRRIFGPPRSFL